MLDISIIIVNYNTKQLLSDCLNSIYKQTKDIVFEVIVSDNGSADGSIEMLKKDFPQVILIENNANLGFGAANNSGLEIAKGKYIFYLNSDTILLNNAVKEFFDYWEKNGEKENIGALGCNLQDINGNSVHSGDTLPTTIDFSNHLHTLYGFSKLTLFSIFLHKKLPLPVLRESKKHFGDIGYIIGADLFVKNDESAKFDEDFFMYYEEIYLQWLLQKKGKKRIIIDNPKIIHLEGSSSKKIITDIIRKETSFSSIQNRISGIIYFKKIGIHPAKIILLKFLTIILWLNPILFKNNRKYIKKVILA